MKLKDIKVGDIVISHNKYDHKVLFVDHKTVYSERINNGMRNQWCEAELVDWELKKGIKKLYAYESKLLFGIYFKTIETESHKRAPQYDIIYDD